MWVKREKHCVLCSLRVKIYKNTDKTDGIALRCTSRKCRKRHYHRPEVLQNLKGTLVQNHRHLYLCHLGLSRDARCKFLGVTETVVTEMKKSVCFYCLCALEVRAHVRHCAHGAAIRDLCAVTGRLVNGHVQGACPGSELIVTTRPPNSLLLLHFLCHFLSHPPCLSSPTPLQLSVKRPSICVF